ncbi:hypothetical protein HanRHA438_Chr14g0682611 [Helianthus annuus]|nr:hypothetical protein HanRHA438_Chr14g0682611 [Helianthus annuus]
MNHSQAVHQDHHTQKSLFCREEVQTFLHRVYIKPRIKWYRLLLEFGISLEAQVAAAELSEL